MKYDLSTPEKIRQAEQEIRNRANNQPDAGSYNAAALHGYADALHDVTEQLKSAKPPFLPTGLSIKAFAGRGHNVEIQVNEFLKEYDGHIVSITSSQHDECILRVVIVYQAIEE